MTAQIRLQKLFVAPGNLPPATPPPLMTVLAAILPAMPAKFLFVFLRYDGCRTIKDRTERESWIENYDSSQEKQQKELMMALRGETLSIELATSYIYYQVYFYFDVDGTGSCVLLRTITLFQSNYITTLY